MEQNLFYKFSDDNIKKMMGEEFSKEPLPLRQELEEAINSRILRINHMVKIGAPEFLRKNEQEFLGDCVKALKEGKFAVTEQEIYYNNSYWEKYHQLLDSLRGDN